MSPTRQAFAILFVGFGGIFLLSSIVSVLTTAAENQRKADLAAQAAGFADEDERRAATAKGFDKPALYRQKMKETADVAEAEQQRREAAAAKAKAEAEEDKRRRDVRFQEGATYAMALKKSMKNPDSFKLEAAHLTRDGVYCFEYRATNSFNAIIPGKALLGPGRAATSDQTGFATLWNKYCTKPAFDLDTLVYAFQKGYL